MVQFCMASLLATMVLDDEAMVRRVQSREGAVMVLSDKVMMG